MELHLYTFIAEFRNGTYCSQIDADNIIQATKSWIEKLKTEKKEIKFLGDSIIKQLEILSDNEFYEPKNMNLLKNVWFQHFPTTKGSFFINIVKTEK